MNPRNGCVGDLSWGYILLRKASSQGQVAKGTNHGAGLQQWHASRTGFGLREHRRQHGRATHEASSRYPSGIRRRGPRGLWHAPGATSSSAATEADVSAAAEAPTPAAKAKVRRMEGRCGRRHCGSGGFGGTHRYAYGNGRAWRSRGNEHAGEHPGCRANHKPLHRIGRSHRGAGGCGQVPPVGSLG